MKKVKKIFSKSEKKKAYVSLSHKVHLSFLEGTTMGLSANFEYTIIIDGIEVALLDINGTVVSPIKANDKVFADKGKPFYLEVRARLNSPTGSGSIQLKDLDKNKEVFDKPQEFTFPASGNGGLFLEDVKLP